MELKDTCGDCVEFKVDLSCGVRGVVFWGTCKFDKPGAKRSSNVLVSRAIDGALCFERCPWFKLKTSERGSCTSVGVPNAKCKNEFVASRKLAFPIHDAVVAYVNSGLKLTQDTVPGISEEGRIILGAICMYLETHWEEGKQ